MYLGRQITITVDFDPKKLEIEMYDYFSEKIAEFCVRIVHYFWYFFDENIYKIITLVVALIPWRVSTFLPYIQKQTQNLGRYERKNAFLEFLHFGSTLFGRSLYCRIKNVE
jgi:hypothetical protein